VKKQVYLTFDIETVVTGFSYNPTYYASVFLGAMYIAEELKKRNQKGIFFISLSHKAKDIKYKDYVNCLNILINSLKGYDNIKIEPHIHAFDLPLNFECKDDKFSAYELHKQIELLKWGKDFFNQRGIDVSIFRPGGYNINQSYYDALYAAGYKASSVLLKNKPPNINMLTNEVVQSIEIVKDNGVIEYPVTSVLVKSIKGGREDLLNLSPDFFTIESLAEPLDKLDLINVNFHSFSVFLNRMARENHRNQFLNNVSFILIERLSNKILKKFHIETINTNTIFRKEFIKWLDYFDIKGYETKFIGE
jgi:hypothetical protein